MRPVACGIILIYSGVVTVGQRLRKARKRLRKTQSEIATLLGCTQPTVHAWESDKNPPQTHDLREVARVYGVTLDDLVPRSA